MTAEAARWSAGAGTASPRGRLTVPSGEASHRFLSAGSEGRAGILAFNRVLDGNHGVFPVVLLDGLEIGPFFAVEVDGHGVVLRRSQR